MLRRHEQIQLPGTAHFITTVTRRRGQWFVSAATCRPILEILEHYRAQLRLICHGYVLMPDHLHLLLVQSEGSKGIASLMQLFKSLTVRRVLHPMVPQCEGWKESYDDVLIPGPDAVRTKLKYIAQNPLRADLVREMGDYQWSSIRFYLYDEPGIVSVTPNHAL